MNRVRLAWEFIKDDGTKILIKEDEILEFRYVVEGSLRSKTGRLKSYTTDRYFTIDISSQYKFAEYDIWCHKIVDIIKIENIKED